MLQISYRQNEIISIETIDRNYKKRLSKHKKIPLGLDRKFKFSNLNPIKLLMS